MKDKERLMPSVSVIMPAYNAEKTIEDAIASALRQTYADIEVIVIDDHSNDGTYGIVKKLAEADERVRILTNGENLGAASSRNKGIKEARGKYIALLDSDDLWYESKLMRQIECLEKSDADIVSCSYSIIDEEGKKRCEDFMVPEHIDYRSVLVCSTLSCSTVLLRRDAIEGFEFPEGVYHEDLAYWLELLGNGLRAIGLVDVLAAYRVRSGSRSSDKLKSAYRRWKLYRRHLKIPFLKSLGLWILYAANGLKKYKQCKTLKTEVDNIEPPLHRAHQLVMLEMLGVLDDICRRNGIRYMLFAGTALGAVRHSGFIPWDDDLDVIMQREDYERFLSVAEFELGEKYFLQKEFSRHWPMFFSKLRRNDTTCIERYIPRDEEVHQGIYIDIFPCDSLSDNKLVRIMQFVASKVVIAKSLDRRGYLCKDIGKRIFMLLCRLIPQTPMLKLAQCRRDKHSREVHCFFAAASAYDKSVFSRKWMEKSVNVDFEGRKFPITAYSDELLSLLYGDYMTPTPKGQREAKRHAEIVDLEHSYEKYIGIQKTMKFKEYTRSIR